MKQLFAITLAIASLTVFAQPAKTPIAATTSAPTPTDTKAPKTKMKLAKKKDHSKDKKTAAIKSPKKAQSPKK